MQVLTAQKTLHAFPFAQCFLTAKGGLISGGRLFQLKLYFYFIKPVPSPKVPMASSGISQRSNSAPGK